MLHCKASWLRQSLLTAPTNKCDAGNQLCLQHLLQSATWVSIQSASPRMRNSRQQHCQHSVDANCDGGKQKLMYKHDKHLPAMTKPEMGRLFWIHFADDSAKSPLQSLISLANLNNISNARLIGADTKHLGAAGCIELSAQLHALSAKIEGYMYGNHVTPVHSTKLHSDSNCFCRLARSTLPLGKRGS